ncbi:primosomal protein N' [Candidatus Methylospira mobilis]|uniref:primosomal protein N' n=1 Tax=Candidatus Methylospira mobilis TaxID=1808979 RepID=UPI0028E40C88|nr:primosomal protein N' [Candidatus Methylospira mobilis]WNV03179.1 primosomal protein N' [Candidatus Methylospira mobilis]
MRKREDFFQFHAVQVALPLPLRQVFDYMAPPEAVESGLQVGARVLVPFGSGQGERIMTGVVTGFPAVSQEDRRGLKPVLQVLDEQSLLSSDDCEILLWASRYYHHPIGEVFASAFPVLLRKGRPAVDERTTRILRLTALGVAAQPPAQAVRRRLLLDSLRAREDGIPLPELSALDWDWRSVVRGMRRQGWVEIADAPQVPLSSAPLPSVPMPELNETQRRAVDAVLSSMEGYRAFLLEGVTGSGKTEVYLRLVEQALQRGLQSLVLVPEISLTPQLESRFQSRFGLSVRVFHSALNESERARNWQAFQRGAARIMLGTRSAVFAPMSAPGLIILDEEHDLSFKQQDGFRFSARDIAVMRARTLNIPVLMGSATPSLESLVNVARKRYLHLSMPKRAGAALEPVFQLVDIRNAALQGGMSPALLNRIAETLKRGEQSLLFLNRRGYAPTLICHACGWVGICPRCDVNLVVHESSGRLCCHRCGYEQARMRRCPACGAEDMRALGLGTERVELALRECFPQARTLRIDRDSARGKGRLAEMLDTVHDGAVDILLGTQMLAKGHHFPDVTLVGILNVDAGLTSPDFRALEHAAQLIVQVAGRAGRAEKPGHVMLQTRYPDHPLLLKLLREGYAAFSARLLEERKSAALPPYSYQALWRAEANDAEKPMVLLSLIRDFLEKDTGGVQVLGPVRAPLARQAGRHRCQLLFQSQQRPLLHKKIDEVIAQLAAYPQSRRARWSVEIEPVDFL